MEGGSGVVPRVGAMVNTGVAIASGSSSAAGGSGRSAAAGGSRCGPAAGGSRCGPAAGGSGCGPAAGGSGCGPAAGGSGCGAAAGGSGCGPAAGGSGCGPAAGGTGCGAAAAGSGCSPARLNGADVDGAAGQRVAVEIRGSKAVGARARVDCGRAALEVKVDSRLDELGIDAQHVAVCRRRHGVAAVSLDRGLATGAVEGDVVGPDDVLVGIAAVRGVGDRGVVRVHLRIGHGDVVDEGVIARL